MGCFFFFLILRRPPRSPLFPDTTLFRSHKGVPFHHGYGEMTASDVIWTLENGVEKGTVRSVKPYKRTFFVEGGGMSAPDDYTLEIDTVVPRWDLTWFLSMGMTPLMGNGIASQKYYQDLGEEKAGYTQAVGPGPWRSGERRVGNECRSGWSPDHLQKK